MYFVDEFNRYVRLAQLDRAFGYGPKGREFESSNARIMPAGLQVNEKHSVDQGAFFNSVYESRKRYFQRFLFGKICDILTVAFI